MTLDDFVESIGRNSEAPDGISPELESLWLVKKGRWEESHRIAQDIATRTGSRIHGLLHAIEGDLGNAGYWYRKAGRSVIAVSQIDDEWRDLVSELLAHPE